MALYANGHKIAPIIKVSTSFVVITCNKTLATLTCGSQSYTLTGTETSHAFQVVSNAIYTCTASLTGYETATGTVTVTTDNIYNMTLDISGLPNTYQEVEYLQSSGEQYIDTNVSLGISNFVINCNAEITATPASESPLMSIWTTQYNYWNFFLTNYVFDMYLSGHVRSTSSYSIGTPLTISIERTFTAWLYTVNSETINCSYAPAATNNTSLKLFARGDVGGFGYYKISSFSIYINNILTINLIPCYRISDSKPGMYDTVTDTFFTNANSSASTDFIVGPDVN